MNLSRYLSPLAVLAVTLAVVGMTAERSRELVGTINFLTLFGTTVAILAIAALGLNIQWGYTGVFNFGIVGFFMTGAYTAAIVTKEPSDSEFVTYIGGFGDKLDFIPGVASDQWLPFLVAILAAGLASGVLAFLLSIPTLRLREDYLAITTIGVAELLRRVTIEERGLVNGTRGLVGIPHPLSGVLHGTDYAYLFLGLAVVALVIAFVALERGVRSPWGRVLRALREDETATEASGKNVYAFKTQGFVLGAVIMGMGGAMYGFQQSTLSPDTFTHFFGTFLIWAMLMVGGSGNNKGAIMGAYVVWGFWTIAQLLNSYDLPEAITTRIGYIRDLVIGGLIVIVLLARPQGLLPEERRVSIWVERRLRKRPPSAQPPPEATPSPQ